jgi:Ornithine/acetylornithine aminotransferase
MLTNISISLKDLLGESYCKSVAECAVLLHGLDSARAEELITKKVDFYSEDFKKHQNELIDKVGKQIVGPFENGNWGAPTTSFANASNLKASPIGAAGVFRIGEDGRLYLVSKSEHYHTSLGHHFGGYKLIDFARELGIPNATHNNTRGFITRITEREIIRCINGIDKGNEKKLLSVLKSKKPKVLNRVTNLETGSLAVEAGIKMLLGRFYKLESSNPTPKYTGKIPVFLVIADNQDGFGANYHGTTVLAQTLRGMWPDFYKACESKGVYKIVSVRKNDIADFDVKMKKYNKGKYKTAGFLHEIVLMNYGGIRLTEDFLQQAYSICEQYDTPTLDDEIQSCMWYKGIFLCRQYGLKPDIVILGKGFSGGEYPASKVISTYEMDCLTQFGALVTNGQEELASLAYLITMEFVQANGDEIQKSGDYFENIFKELNGEYPGFIDKIEGRGHLLSIHFKTMEAVKEFASRFNNHCMDISVQTYKPNCPPAALIKMPLTTTIKTMDYMRNKTKETLQDMLDEGVK